MTPITKEEMERRADAYMAARERDSGVKIPFAGVDLVLVRKIMAGFACQQIARELQEMLS